MRKIVVLSLLSFFSLVNLAVAQQTANPTIENQRYIELKQGYQQCLQSGKLAVASNTHVGTEPVATLIITECSGASAAKLFKALHALIGHNAPNCEQGITRNPNLCWVNDSLIFGSATSCTENFEAAPYHCTIRLDKSLDAAFAKALATGANYEIAQAKEKKETDQEK